MLHMALPAGWGEGGVGIIMVIISMVIMVLHLALPTRQGEGALASSWSSSFPSPPPPSLGYTRSTSVCVVDMPLALRALHVMMFANEFKKLVSMPIYFASCKLCKHAFGIICAATKSASLYITIKANCATCVCSAQQENIKS